MNENIKNKAAELGIEDELSNLEKALLKTRWVTNIDFDISHSYNKTYNVTITVRYEIPKESQDHFGSNKAFTDSIIDVVKSNGFRFVFSGMDDIDTLCNIVACIDTK